MKTTYISALFLFLVGSFFNLSACQKAGKLSTRQGDTRCCSVSKSFLTARQMDRQKRITERDRHNKRNNAAKTIQRAFKSRKAKLYRQEGIWS